MGNSGSTPKVSAQDKAILDLKVQRDKLHQYQRRITVVTARETEIAKEHLRKGDRARALLALRRKKYQESLLSKTDQQLAQLEILTSDVEFALVQKDVLFGLQQGTAVLKDMRKEMGGLENVEKLIGESEEEKQYQKELTELLNGRMTNQEEDEVEDELALMEAQANAAKLGQTLPKTPETVPQRSEEEQEAISEAPNGRVAKERKERKDRQAAEAMLA